MNSEEEHQQLSIPVPTPVPVSIQLKKIINVYQSRYNGQTSYGLGDFLRGCVFTMQFCKLELAGKVCHEIDFSNHPMGKYLANHCIKREDINYNNVPLCNYSNRLTSEEHSKKYFLRRELKQQFHNDCKNSFQTNSYFAFSTNAYPILQVVSEQGKQFLRESLKPTAEFETLIAERMNVMGIQPNKYGVIHIRSGDEFLVDGKKTNATLYLNIRNNLLKWLIPNRNYLLLSDNNELKQLIGNDPVYRAKGLNIILHTYPIVHMQIQVDGVNSSTDGGVLNTLLDFFIMSRSNSIFAMSTYGHVTGFSRWCSTIYGIPFKCIRVDK